MRLCIAAAALVLVGTPWPGGGAGAQGVAAPPGSAASALPAPDLSDFPPEHWQRVNRAVTRGLAWLSTQQQADGSFRTRASGQPGVTSLCVLAYLSAGHVPGEGPYGKQLDRAIQFAVGCQRGDGLISYRAPTVPVNHWGRATHAATYNHGITGVMLSEVYGLVGDRRTQEVSACIQAALVVTRRLQVQSRRFAEQDHGGWRYLQPVPGGAEQSDMPSTSWQLMFYRSAKNAGFPVPKSHVDEGVRYVKRMFHPTQRQFHYGVGGHHPYATRTTIGAGVVCLMLGAERDPRMEQASARSLVRIPFRPYNRKIVDIDRYHYGSFYMSQAAFLLGGQTWRQVYGDLTDVFLENQNPDGSWKVDSMDGQFGQTYTTSLSVLALTPPYQLLPIYQR